MIKVMVVEDSAVSRALIRRILEADTAVEVVATANNGKEALALLAHHNPDVLTMDIHMPVMDGFEATKEIMANDPLPIVIVSASMNPRDVKQSFRALEAGAVACLEKPSGLGHPDFEEHATKLCKTVKSMSRVRVIRRRKEYTLRSFSGDPDEAAPEEKQGCRMFVIGASTGGPVAIRDLLCGLPDELPAPVMIAQHISDGFASGLVEWLDATVPQEVRVARNGEVPRNGVVYVSPAGRHIEVAPGGSLRTVEEPPELGCRPSANRLLRSAARIYGASAVGILLTGMGKDGAQGLKELKEAGALTFAQDERSSVVFGMPGEAVRIGAACHIMAPRQMAFWMCRNLLCNVEPGPSNKRKG